MNKKELVGSIAEKGGVTKKLAGEMLDTTLEAIAEGLVTEGKVGLVGFGTFEVRDSAERKGTNPQNGDEIVIPASKRVAFKVSKNLKAMAKNI